MKSPPPPVASDAAFPDPHAPPGAAEAAGVLQTAGFSEVARLFAWLEQSHPGAALEWKYSRRSGWYEVPTLNQRRLFYFIPKFGDFRLNLVLGDRAIVSLAKTEHAKPLTSLLKNATRYPEGTLFSFDRHSFDFRFVAALLDAKLKH